MTVDRTFEEWDKRAAEAIDEAEADIKDLWGKARAAAKGEPPPDPNETVTLEARPEAVKVLYARVLAAQCLVDGRLDPREIQYLYVFMSRIGLGPTRAKRSGVVWVLMGWNPKMWSGWSSGSSPKSRETKKRSPFPSSKT
jgi:hypothetical protein